MALAKIARFLAKICVRIPAGMSHRLDAFAVWGVNSVCTGANTTLCRRPPRRQRSRRFVGYGLRWQNNWFTRAGTAPRSMMCKRSSISTPKFSPPIYIFLRGSLHVCTSHAERWSQRPQIGYTLLPFTLPRICECSGHRIDSPRPRKTNASLVLIVVAAAIPRVGISSQAGLFISL